MKPKKLAVLIVVLALLVAAGLWKKSELRRSERAAAQKPAQTQVPLGPGFSTAFVTKVELRRGSSDPDKLVLVKDASDSWTLQSRYGTHAQKSTVEDLLRSLTDLRGEVRAEDNAVLGDFSLTDEKAFHFELSGSDGHVLSHILLSPLRPRGTQNFVRLDRKSVV